MIQASLNTRRWVTLACNSSILFLKDCTFARMIEGSGMRLYCNCCVIRLQTPPLLPLFLTLTFSPNLVVNCALVQLPMLLFRIDRIRLRPPGRAGRFNWKWLLPLLSYRGKVVSSWQPGSFNTMALARCFGPPSGMLEEIQRALTHHCLTLLHFPLEGHFQLFCSSFVKVSISEKPYTAHTWLKT